MQIVVTGVNHTSAPLTVRERLFVADDRLATELTTLRADVGACFVLSTCNRTEVYAECGHEGTGGELLRRWFAARAGVDQSEIERVSYVRAHASAVIHAFRVASGLDSMIVGEEQILGQMRRAVSVAREAGTLGPLLDRLGSSALACGKRVRAASEMGNRPASVVSVAIDAARRLRGTLEDARVLVIGSGETAALAVALLTRKSRARITVINRTPERAAAMALAHGIQAAAWDDLPRMLSTVDLVMSCTSATAPVLGADMVRAARQAGAGSALVCVDLGVPRDIEPQVGELDGVTLIDIDRVGTLAGTLHSDRVRPMDVAEEMVADEADRFMTWWRERDVAPAIARLHDHARRIADAELERALARLPSLTPREADVIRALATRLTSKLLHDPTIALKRDAEGPNMAIMLDRLFGLTTPDDVSPRAASGSATDRAAPSSMPLAE